VHQDEAVRRAEKIRQALLETMRETLTQMESHRDSILRELADMEKQGR
jgi:hypothetical protein